MPSLWGELAALTTSICWTGTATFFTFASRKVGALVVNRVRLLAASAFLLLTRTILLGGPLPLEAEPSRWLWLGLSGIIGLAIGDAFLFQAYIWIGPRLSMLVMASVPVMSALLAWAALGQRLLLVHWLGIAVTVAGIVWVVLGHDSRPDTPPTPHFLRGVLFAFGAAAGQAIGLVLAREGLAGDFPALSGNVIRMISAATAIWLVALLQRQAGLTFRRLADDRSAWAPLLGGSVFGPYIGVWLSLIAIQFTDVGIASALMALPPVFLLPVDSIVFKEKIGWQAIAGTAVAIAGAVLLLVT
jgi:drug/metabolite transporter (DMT)-like permease